MLQITIPGEELYDEDAQEFIEVGAVTLRLEHSLVSLSKWESKFEKPFISKNDKTPEEMIEYVHMMCLDPDFPREKLQELSQKNVEDIVKYIESKQSATWFNDNPTARPNREVITSEIIYFWMVTLRIPFECQDWHLNRLLTLIRVCNEKTQKPTKQNKQTSAQQRRDLNAQRRQMYNTTG